MYSQRCQSTIHFILRVIQASLFSFLSWKFRGLNSCSWNLESETGQQIRIVTGEVQKLYFTSAENQLWKLDNHNSFYERKDKAQEAVATRSYYTRRSRDSLSAGSFPGSTCIQLLDFPVSYWDHRTSCLCTDSLVWVRRERMLPKDNQVTGQGCTK